MEEGLEGEHVEHQQFFAQTWERKGCHQHITSFPLGLDTNNHLF